MVAAQFKIDLIALVPQLRAFAHTLSGDHAGADDLAQEALIRAWQHRASFEPGSNLRAWLFTILRNHFYSSRRRASRRAPWNQDVAERAGQDGGQIWAAELSDVARALRSLPIEQREAVILVGAGGFAYEEAASINECAVGTIKSRVARGRRALIAMLDGERALPLCVHPKRGGAADQIIEQVVRFTSTADCPRAQQQDGNLKRASARTAGSPRAFQRKD